MEISYSKYKNKKSYINFRIRNIIKKFCIANSEKMKLMNDLEKAIFISTECELLLCSEFWVKQKQKVNEQSKAA